LFLVSLELLRKLAQFFCHLGTQIPDGFAGEPAQVDQGGDAAG